MMNLNYQNIVATNGLPTYPDKSPEQIITDYLQHILDYLLEAVFVFSQEFRVIIPIDIVLTIPMVTILLLY
jgi:hypothetical protein